MALEERCFADAACDAALARGAIRDAEASIGAVEAQASDLAPGSDARQVVDATLEEIRRQLGRTQLRLAQVEDVGDGMPGFPT